MLDYSRLAQRPQHCFAAGIDLGVQPGYSGRFSANHQSATAKEI